jgi:hypothetical protein
MTNDVITIIDKANGDKTFRAQIEGFENIDLVTLQKDGEIRWASVGPMSLENSLHFHDALRLALFFACRNAVSNDYPAKDRLAFNIAGGVTYRIQEK